MRFAINMQCGAGMLAVAAFATSAALAAQERSAYGDYADDQSVMTTVYGEAPADFSELPEGPSVEGYISAQRDGKMQVTSSDGAKTSIFLSEGTDIRASGGFLGISKTSLGTKALLNGLPVKVKTVQWGQNLVARQIRLKNKDMKIASMIHSGTEQGFAEQTAATEALRGRVANIDNYNIKSTTNVNFETGKALLSPQAKVDLCAAAAKAQATDNALLLVVGYTDSTGSQEFNQMLSEKRAGSVVNYLQQACDWAPWRMLTPTGMAEADPLADNTTEYGKAQNRRVAVNILVSKSVDGL